MRITLESDYALRILTELARYDSIIDAKTLSEKTAVTPRFTLKILHKLTGSFVKSYKGVNGGYKLKEDPKNITLKNVIELIDGPIAMIRCIGSSESCALNKDKTSCIYHHIFETISSDVAKKLSAITIYDVLQNNYDLK